MFSAVPNLVYPEEDLLRGSIDKVRQISRD